MKTTFAKPAAIAALVAAAAVCFGTRPALADTNYFTHASNAAVTTTGNWTDQSICPASGNDTYHDYIFHPSRLSKTSWAYKQITVNLELKSAAKLSFWGASYPEPWILRSDKESCGWNMSDNGWVSVGSNNGTEDPENASPQETELWICGGGKWVSKDIYIGGYSSSPDYSGRLVVTNGIFGSGISAGETKHSPVSILAKGVVNLYNGSLLVASGSDSAKLTANSDINLFNGSLTIVGETSVVTSGNNVVVGGIRGANLPNADFNVYMRAGALLAAKESLVLGGWYSNEQNDTGKIFAEDSKITAGKQMHIASNENSAGEIHVTNCTVKVTQQAVQVGRAVNSTGVYDMNGGTLDVGGSFLLGNSAGAKGTALFSGGARITADTIYAGSGTGSVTFDGATFAGTAAANTDIIPSKNLTVSIAKGGATIKASNNAKIGAVLRSAAAEGETDGGVTFAGGKAITVNSTITYNGTTTVQDNTQLKVDAESAASILQNGLSIVANKEVGGSGVAILTISDGSALPETRNISLSGKYAESCIVEEVGDCVKLIPAGLTFYVADDNMVLNCDFEDSTTPTSGKPVRYGVSGYDNPKWKASSDSVLMAPNKSGGWVDVSGFGKYACALQTTTNGRDEAWFSQELVLEAGRYEISFEAAGRDTNKCYGGVVHVSLIQGSETNDVGRLEVPDRNVKHALTNTVEVAAGGTYALTFWQVATENTQFGDAMTMIDNVVVRQVVEKTRRDQWIRESESTAGTTGAWRPSREYVSGVVSPDIEAVFTPFSGSVGNIVEVRSTLKFSRYTPAPAEVSRTARAAVCIVKDENGAKFMLYTSDENGPKWVEATAPGVEVDPSAEYTVSFWFYQKKGEYKAYVMGKGYRTQLEDATTGEGVFPFATQGGTTSIGRVGFEGSGSVESIRGRDALQTGSFVYLR